MEVTTKKKSIKRTHIIKRGKGWALKKEGNIRATKLYETKDAAIKDAQKDRKNGSDVVIHKTDGTVEKWEKAK